MIKSFLIFPQKPFPFLNPGWSLEHEVLFYAIAAIVAPLLGLRPLAVLLTVLWIVGQVFSFSWDYHLFADPQIYFAAGVIAYLHRERGWRAAAPAAIGLLGFAYACYYNVISIPLQYAGVIFAFGCAALIVAFIDIEQYVPLPRLAVAIGDASYSLYLWHWLVIPLCALFFGMYGGAPEIWRWIIVAGSIAVALAGYRFIEAPLIALSHGTLRKPVAA